MATTATVSNGVVTLNTTLRLSDFDGALIRGSGGQTYQSLSQFVRGTPVYYISLSLSGFKVSVYDPNDFNDRGEPERSPFFGTVLRDSFRNRHGRISTDTIDLTGGGFFGPRMAVLISTDRPAHTGSTTVATFRLTLGVGKRRVGIQPVIRFSVIFLASGGENRAEIPFGVFLRVVVLRHLGCQIQNRHACRYRVQHKRPSHFTG